MNEVDKLKGQLLYVAIAATFGIVFSRYYFDFMIITLMFMYIGYLLIRKKYSLLFFVGAVFLFFSLYTYFVEKNNKTNLIAGEYHSKAILDSSFLIDGDLFRGTLIDKSGEKLVFTYYMKTYEEKIQIEKFKPGQTCHFSGELEQLKLPTMPNAFNYKQYLYDKKIHWRLKISSISACSESSLNMMTFLQTIRKNGLLFIEKHYPQSSGGIVQALIFGERSLIADEVETAYEELGIVHLLAISGLHVGLLVGGLYYIFIRVGITHNKARVIFIVLLPAYIVLCGGAPSVMRASIMVIVYFVFKSVRWNIRSVDIISSAYIFMLILNPYELFHIGFQLSYVVSFTLIASSSIISSFHSWFMRSALIAILSQLGAAPILLFHFYEISVLSLPMNLLFVPFYSFFVLPAAIITVCLQSINMGELCIFFLDGIIEFSHELVKFVSSFTLFTLTLGKPSTVQVFLYVFSLLLFFVQFEKAKHIKDKFYSFFIIIIVFSIQFFTPFFTPYGKVMVIDVGQGDSLFIQQPFKKGSYLIDTGGRLSFNEKGEWAKRNKNFSFVKDVTIPYLKSIAVTEIDSLFLTHGDTDHVGEVSTLLDEIKVKEIIIPIGFIRGELEKEIINKAMKKKIKLTVVKAGDYIKKGRLSFYVLSPHKLTESKNDDSLVLYSKIGGISWLFTGDLEHHGEAEIIKQYNLLKIDVLKVGHHGSKGSTSDEFLNKLDPSIAIVSAGYKNRYNHPHQEVVEKLEERNIPLLRTDIQGAILYEYRRGTGTFLLHPPYDIVNETRK